MAQTTDWSACKRLPPWERPTATNKMPIWKHVLTAFSPLARTLDDLQRGNLEGEEQKDLFGFNDDFVFNFVNEFGDSSSSEEPAQKLHDLCSSNGFDQLVQVGAAVCFGFGNLDEVKLSDHFLRRVGSVWADEFRDTTLAFCHLIRSNLDEGRFYSAVSFALVLDWIATNNQSVAAKLSPGKEGPTLLVNFVQQVFAKSFDHVSGEKKLSNVTAIRNLHIWIHFLSCFPNTCRDFVATAIIPNLELELLKVLEVFRPRHSAGKTASHEELIENDLLSSVCLLLRYAQVHERSKSAQVLVAASSPRKKTARAVKVETKPSELEITHVVKLFRTLFLGIKVRPLPVRDYARGVFLHGLHYLEGVLKTAVGDGRPPPELRDFLHDFEEDRVFQTRLNNIKQWTLDKPIENAVSALQDTITTSAFLAINKHPHLYDSSWRVGKKKPVHPDCGDGDKFERSLYPPRFFEKAPPQNEHYEGNAWRNCIKQREAHVKSWKRKTGAEVADEIERESRAHSCGPEIAKPETGQISPVRKARMQLEQKVRLEYELHEAQKEKAKLKMNKLGS